MKPSRSSGPLTPLLSALRRGAPRARPDTPTPAPSAARSRSSNARRTAAAVALALLGLARPAMATGMQGHIYMAQCAAEQIADERLRPIFDAYPLHLVNGAFFPDSGYTADDREQGEIPHWDGYVEGYIQLLRERFAAPSTDKDAAPHVAFLMGIAAHGITDSTFDTLIFSRAEQIEPGNMDGFDTAMDIFLVQDMPRYFIPDLELDAQTQSDVFAGVSHPVSPDSISEAMSTARTGISVVSELLYKSADDFGAEFPWARRSFLDARTPGGYAFGAKVVIRYYEEILRRLDGDVSADKVVIGTYPDASYPMVTLDRTRADGKIVLFFGRGLDRSSITADTVVVHDAQGNVVPTHLDVFRGDAWANVITVEPAADWLPATTYTAVLSQGIRTLNGTSPSQDFQLSFTTCVPVSPGGDCPDPAGSPPASLCPKTEAKYLDRPVKAPEEEPEMQGKPPAKVEKAVGGCAAAPMPQDEARGPLLLFVLAAMVGARRLRARAGAGHPRRVL